MNGTKRMSDRTLTEEEHEDYLEDIERDGYREGFINQEGADCPYEEGTEEYDSFMIGADAGMHEWLYEQGRYDERTGRIWLEKL